MLIGIKYTENGTALSYASSKAWPNVLNFILDVFRRRRQKVENQGNPQFGGAEAQSRENKQKGFYSQSSNQDARHTQLFSLCAGFAHKQNAVNSSLFL